MKRWPANYFTCEQHSPEWRELRRGNITASRIAELKPLVKGDESQKSKDYKLELLSEILSLRMAEHYVSPAMDWGIQTEPLAREEYELKTGLMVDRIGFVIHPRLPRCGASPDGLVGDDGLVEIKCPNTSTHLQYLISGVVPDKYKPQMYWQMACCERQWCDFVSFDPRLDEKFQLFIARLERDEKDIAKWESLAMDFVADLNSMAGVLQGYEVVRPKSQEDKLRASIKQAGKYDPELVAAFNEDFVP